MSAGALLAFGICLALSPLALLGLRRLGILDHPNARSSHDVPMFRGGGLAPFLACIASGTLLFERSLQATGLLLAAGLFGLLGLVEDIRGVPALTRLPLQIIFSALASLYLLSDLTGPLAWKVVFAAGAVVWIAAYANAFNFMDGINGISGAQVVVASAAWVVVGRIADEDLLTSGAATVGAAALAFLPFNFPAPQMFLGDVGSYFLGAWLASLVVIALRAGVPPEATVAPVALYLVDTGTTIVKRLLEGESLHVPHRRHTYQRLVRSGWTHTRTTLVVAGFIAVTSALGVASFGPLPGRVAADAAMAGVLVIYLALPRAVEQRTPASV